MVDRLQGIAAGIVHQPATSALTPCACIRFPPAKISGSMAVAIQLDKGAPSVTTNPLKDLPGYLLRRASAWTMAELARRLEELDLTPTEASVLVVIASNPGIIQREIGQMLGIVSANMTPLVSRL